MLRARTIKTEAIVLRQQEFGEADRLLTLVTPMLGKLRVLAKGVRRATSRKAGHVELFVRSEMLLSKGRDMHLVTQADTIAPHRPVRENLSAAVTPPTLLNCWIALRPRKKPARHCTSYFRPRLAGFLNRRSPSSLHAFLRPSCWGWPVTSRSCAAVLSAAARSRRGRSILIRWPAAWPARRAAAGAPARSP